MRTLRAVLPWRQSCCHLIAAAQMAGDSRRPPAVPDSTVGSALRGASGPRRWTAAPRTRGSLRGLQGAGRCRATRNPLLLFRFEGVFLLRLAERSLAGWLFHEAPRKTRARPRLSPAGKPAGTG